MHVAGKTLISILVSMRKQKYVQMGKEELSVTWVYECFADYMDTEIKMDYKPLVLILTWTEVH